MEFLIRGLNYYLKCCFNVKNDTGLNSIKDNHLRQKKQRSAKSEAIETIKYKNGDYYEGEVKNNKPNGEGKYVWTRGTIYEGDFVDGNFDGKGAIRCPNGDFYEGEFKNDKFNGKGKYVFTNGNTYEGEFVEGSFCGLGVFSQKNGTVYTGEFKDDKYNGRGIKRFADGSYYEGEFKIDKFNGKGKIVWNNGDYFEGFFENNNCVRKGSFTGYDNNTLKGEMINKIFGTSFEGTWETPEETIFEGEISSKSNSKWGVYIRALEYKDRIRDLIKSDFNFSGKITWPNGEVFEGSCTNLKPYEGKGVWHSNYGSVFDKVEKGRWKEGVKKRI